MKLAVIFPTLVLGGAACSAAFAAAAGMPPAADFLYAIRQVESGDRYDGPAGKAGELGPYQFRLQVWYQHTQAPFSQARTAFADDVALRHYEWLAERLRTAGLPATSWNIAAAWNSGIAAVRSGHVPRSTRDYAKRVQNLVESRVGLQRPKVFPVQLVMAGTH